MSKHSGRETWAKEYAYTCPRHDIKIPKGQPCRRCRDELAQATAPEAMTWAERSQEFFYWYDPGTLTVPMPELVKRLSGLLGRSIWTHEFVPKNRANLLAEFNTQIHPTTEDTLVELKRQYPHIHLIDEEGNAIGGPDDLATPE